MHHAPPVRLVQRIGNLEAQLQPLAQTERSTLEPRSQCFAFQVLHDEEVDRNFTVRGALLTDVVQHANVRVTQRREGLRFAVEPLPHFQVVCEMGRQHFDGDDAVQARVARTIDFAHSTSANGEFDFVRSESCAGC